MKPAVIATVAIAAATTAESATVVRCKGQQQ